MTDPFQPSVQNSIPPINGVQQQPGSDGFTLAKVATDPLVNGNVPSVPQLDQSLSNSTVDLTTSGRMTNVSTPTIADDVDLIEKEWVKKIAEVVQKTTDNPYERAQQLSVIKQDYLQKRYNKSIKLE